MREKRRKGKGREHKKRMISVRDIYRAIRRKPSVGMNEYEYENEETENRAGAGAAEA